jgi:WD40 repeat protein
MAFFEAVLGNLAVASAIAVVAFAVSRWARCPALTHTLWLLVLIKLLTPPLVTIPIRCLPAQSETLVKSPGAASTSHNASESAPVVIVESTQQATNTSTRETTATTASTVEANTQPVSHSVVPAQTGRWLPSWESLVLGLWGVGSLISIGLVVRRARRFARLLHFASPAPGWLVDEVAVSAGRLGLRSVPRVRVVPGGIAPLVWAVGRPTLYFPAGLLDRLSTEQRLALVTHELAHLRRWDHVVRLIEFAALALYWWCPLAWLARRELRRIEEEACDAEVLAAVPGCGYAYASAILETIEYLAGVAPSPRLASGIGDAASLKRRMVLILNTTSPRGTSRRTRLVLLLAGIALLAVGPKLTRLSASAVDAVFGNSTTSTSTSTDVPVTVDEAFIEPIHFLPAPARLLPAESAPDSSLAGSAALSPDGTRLALASGSAVVVWDLARRQVLFTLVGHTEQINAVVFSPDGSRVATVANDTSGMIWDANNGKPIHTLTGHGKWVLSVAFSPDGKTLATGGYDKRVLLWDTASGELRSKWTGHAGGVRSVAFSPDGQTVATGGADNEVRLWDVRRGVTTHILKKHSAAVRVVVFSPDGTRLASGSEDRTVLVWNPADGRAIGQAVSLPDYSSSLAFSRRGQALYAGTFGGHLLHINPLNGQLRGYVGVEPGKSVSTPTHSDAVIAILNPPDGKSLYTVSQDRVALVWPAAGPPQTPKLVLRGAMPMTAVAISPDGTLLATAGQDGVIHIWNATTVRELMTLPGHPGGVSSLMFGAGGRLVSAGADERVRVWDTESGHATYTVLQPTADLFTSISPDGKTLAIGGRKLSGVMLVNLATKSKARRVGESDGEVTAVAFTPTGTRLATGYANGWVRIWDAITGEELANGQVGAASVDGISFNANETVAAVVVNGVPRAESENEAGPTHEVVFVNTHDGWVLENLRPLAHPGPITAAAFTVDGHVLTAAHDGNLYLWNIQTGQAVRTIRGHVDAVRGVALAADGTAIFSAGDRAAKKWPLNTK